MRAIIATALLAVSLSANAGIICHRDYVGNYICIGDDGYESITRRNYIGEDETTDNRGNKTTCRTDYVGNYICEAR